MSVPDPSRYRAEWSERAARGNRLGSRNLWIYDRETGQKRFSVTTQAGIKIQPYFEVPDAADPNLYHIVVQGEPVDESTIRVWLSESTARDMDRILAEAGFHDLSDAVVDTDGPAESLDPANEEDQVRELTMTRQGYARLLSEFDGPNDELRVRAFLTHLESLRD